MYNEEVEYMDTSEVPWVIEPGTQWFWYYLADCGRWHRFEDDPHNSFSSEDVERYYQRNKSASVLTHSSNCHIKTDFSGTLRFLSSHSCLCFIAAPVFWDAVDHTRPYQLITLNERNPEYHTVASYVKKDGLLDRSILSIFRIQNMDLWELFCRKKQQLMRIHGVKDIQEKRLFHGTNITNVDTICKYNFDLRLAGQHGSVFGKGIYFAIHASYADKYSQSSTDPLPVDGWNAHNRRTKIMFLARVIVGTSTVGGEDFRKPDHESPENTHDSCVNDINNPSIFVIFDPNQIYPEYLIHYK
uniref:Poly [ADP-ribose] polymerase n=1 Tax=Acanthochromis polyacanthus TaxID=80966 RepID=A0A3Q1GEA1_9TELE